MVKGKVKFFNTEKGFGFIAGEDNNDYFVHSSDTTVDLTEDLSVEFDIIEGDRGLKATNVKLE